jgi:hypothetical protein
MERTGLAHRAEMGVEPALVIAERRVHVRVGRDPAAHLLAELPVCGRRPVQLVGERAEQAITVA